jgi:regulator of sigma E protease
MDFLQYPLALIVTLGVLVTVHELGHYLIARWSGVRVVRFSVGFGRPLVSWTDSRGTEFAIAYIPLGGYVRMLDDQEMAGEAGVARPGDVSYRDLDVWWRIAIAFGGPAANFLLAILVYWFLFVVGSVSIAPIMGDVDPDSAAGRAGLRANYEIVAVDGVATGNWQQVTMALAGRLGESGSIEITSQRPGSESRRGNSLYIDTWHAGAEEPDLLGSLGIVPSMPAIVGEVLPGGAGERSGLRQWDRVVGVDGEALATWGEWVAVVQESPGRTMELAVDRGDRIITVPITPDSKPADDGTAMGYVGVASYFNEVRYGALDAVPRSLSETWDKTLLTLGLLKKMVTGHVSVKNLSGPITIAKVAADSARSGWRFFFSVLALLSISLGVLNLLPIPILDGGHIMFCAAEAFMGKPVSERVQLLGAQVGLVVVAGLMIVVIYNDINRLL